VDAGPNSKNLWDRRWSGLSDKTSRVGSDKGGSQAAKNSSDLNLRFPGSPTFAGFFIDFDPFDDSHGIHPMIIRGILVSRS
jgi:hypothetical protein